MKKLWCLIFILISLPLNISGQNAYYATDSSMSSGVKLIDGGDVVNSRLCQVQKG